MERNRVVRMRDVGHCAANGSEVSPPVSEGVASMRRGEQLVLPPLSSVHAVPAMLAQGGHR